MTLRNPEMSLAQVLKPFPGFESKYQGLVVADNPIALPGTLDQFAGQEGYDPNLLEGIPVPMGAKMYAWLPRFFPQVYAGVSTNYRYQFVWRLRSLAEQVADREQKRASHFGQLLRGVAQEGLPANPAATAALAGPRFVIPTAFESVQIVQNKFIVTEENSTTVVVQKGTDDFSTGDPISPELQDPAEVVAASSRVTSYTSSDPYQAPISPNYPASFFTDAKRGAAGLLSQGFYPDAAGWVTGGANNQGYPAGGMYVVYETEAKGDELIILVSRDNGAGGAAPNWDFSGVDSVFSAIFGTASGTRQSVPTLGLYLMTGTTTGSQASFG